MNPVQEPRHSCWWGTSLFEEAQWLNNLIYRIMDYFLPVPS